MVMVPKTRSKSYRVWCKESHTYYFHVVTTIQNIVQNFYSSSLHENVDRSRHPMLQEKETGERDRRKKQEKEEMIDNGGEHPQKKKT